MPKPPRKKFSPWHVSERARVPKVPKKVRLLSRAPGRYQSAHARMIEASLKEIHAGRKLKFHAERIAKIEKKYQRIMKPLLGELKRVAERSRFMTNLYSKQAFSEKCIAKMNMEKEKHPHSIIFLDLDYFKKFNDKYKHQLGDVLLQTFADAVNEVSRAHGGFAGRYGGEELIAYLPKTHKESREIVYEIDRLLQQKYSQGGLRNFEPNVITFSAGISTLRPENLKDHARDLYDRMIERADHRMYDSKEAGRNRVSIINRQGEVVQEIIRKGARLL